MRRAGLLAVALLAAALILGVGEARAADPPSLTVEVIGQGTVTGTGISCGQGSLSCYSTYGTDPTPVTLTATPATGWTFSGWQDDASSCTTTTPCGPLSVTGAKTATAVFAYAGAAATSTLTVAPATGGALANGSSSYDIDCEPGSSSPPTGPTDCSLTVLAGSTLSMTEAPDSGYLFNGWGGACSGSGPSCAVYLTSSQSVGAAFVAAASTTLTVTVSGNGSVSGGGISCGSGATCSAPEPPNASVTLTASPASGYVLTGWSGTGGCSGTQATCTVQTSAAATVIATFAQVVPLAVTVTGDGYVTGGDIGCDGTALGQTCTANETPNTTVTLTATANSGESVYWLGCTSSAGNICTVTLGTTATAVSATFSGGSAPPVATNSLTLSVTGDGYVTADTGTGTLYCTAAGGAGCTTSVPAGTTVILTAVPASGLAGNFTAWSGACVGFATTSCTLTMNGAQSAGATFAGGNTTYVLTTQVKGNGSVTGAGVDCSGTGAGCSSPQAAGAAVTLTAAPGFGGTFAGWSGACTGTSPTCTVTMSVARSVTATFATATLGSQSLAIQVTGAGSVKASGGTCSSTAGKTKLCTQSYEAGKAVTLTAKAASGAVFSGWKGSCTGAKTTCKVTLSSFVDVSATFGRAVLASTRKPAVAKTSAGHRITLFFAVHKGGSLKLVGKLGTKTVVSRTSKVAAGSRRLVVTVAKPGRYVFTLTLTASGKHSIRWSVKV